ncbi:MAG: SagB/ThcOx family dehydrogenase [Alkaliphilus sp.]
MKISYDKLKERCIQGRNMMKSNFNLTKEIETDQSKEVPQPPLQKPYDENSKIIKLPEFDESIIIDDSLLSCLKKRRSHRKFKNNELSLKELSFLLWATQGVDDIRGNNYATLRPVASAGARHPFETYLLVNNVEGLEKGMYRYLALSHELIHTINEDKIENDIEKITAKQKFVVTAPVLFIWSCIPYRGEWRYSISSHKAMLLDAGHICQNLYLASESIGCGTCAIAAYNQEEADKLVKVSGEEEFVVYMSPVGKIV